MTCFERLQENGDYEDAIEGFQSILESNKLQTASSDQKAGPDGKPKDQTKAANGEPDIRQRAAIGLALAKVHLRREGFFIPIGRGVKGFVQKYLVPIVLLSGFFLVRTGICFPRSGTLVSFSDVNAKPDVATAISRSLTAEFLHLLENPEPVKVSGLRMNTWPGGDQPAFGFVRPAEALTLAEGFSSSQRPIKLGDVEFGLDDAVWIIRRFFSRPHKETLVGWISFTEGSAVAEASLTGVPFRRSRRTHSSWRATATDDGAREKALKDLAAQILIDMRGNAFTDSWQSLRACQDGIRALQLADTESDSNGKARRFFETALEFDSANWIARFYLALSLCGEGDGKPATALRHFQILDEVMERAVQEPGFKERALVKLITRRRHDEKNWIRRFFLGTPGRIRSNLREQIKQQGQQPPNLRLAALLDHLVRYPECPFVVRYNIAIAIDELRRNGGVQEFRPPLGDDVTWTRPLESLKTFEHMCGEESQSDPLKALQALVHFWDKEKDQLRGLSALVARLEALIHFRDTEKEQNGGKQEPEPLKQPLTPDKYFVFERLLEGKEKLELSLYAQSARAHILSIHDPSGSEKELVRILALTNRKCKELRSLNRTMDSWHALETTKAVALSSLARSLSTKGELAADQEARNFLYQAIACEPGLVDAYNQLAVLYECRKAKFAEDWKGRAQSLRERANDFNSSCGNTTILSAQKDRSPKQPA